MIVDVHTHAPLHKEPVPDDDADNAYGAVWRPDRKASRNYTWADFMEAMEPVDKVITFNLAADKAKQKIGDASQWLPAPEVNDITAEFAQAHSDKVIGFLSLHPHDDDALDEIDRCTGDLGLRGIKLGPNYQNFDPLDEKALRVFRRAEELGLPVLFHQGTSPIQFADLDYAHPRHIDRLAIACPDLKMILAHIGHPWQTDCIVVIRKHPNVYADISAQFYRPWSYYNAFRLAAEWGVMHKMLFGSDYFVATPQETIDALYKVNDPVEGTKLPRVPELAMEEILHRNSLELLGLED